MAVPTIIQQGIKVTNGGSPHTFTITGVTSGSTLIVVHFSPNSNRVYSISDDQSNSYTKHENSIGSARSVNIWSAESVASGDTEVTITTNFPSSEDFIYFYELSASTYDTSDEFTNSGGGTTHYGAGVSGITTSADVFVVSVGCHNAPGGTLSAGSGYTKDYEDGGGEGLIQSRTSTSALSGERGQWTMTNSRSDHADAIASFVATGGGGGGSVVPIIHQQLAG